MDESDAASPNDDINIHTFVRGPLRAALQLQGKLPIDERGFLRAAGNSHADARAYYLYGMMDEIARAAIALGRLPVDVLDLGRTDAGATADVASDHVSRLVYEALHDELMLWNRKCVEVVTDLVLFTTTNDMEMYRLYILARQLENRLSSDLDRLRYFLGAGGDGGLFVSLIRSQIAETEKLVDKSKAWFLKSSDLQLVTRPNFFESFGARFARAMTIADDVIKYVATPSYHAAYSLPSQAVHGAIDPFPPSRIDLDTLQTVVRRIGMLGLCAAALAFRLADIQPEGEVEQILSALSRSDAPILLRKGMQQRFSVHDIVLVDGADVALIVASQLSVHGNTVYDVQRVVVGETAPGPVCKIEGFRLKLVIAASDTPKMLENAHQHLNAPAAETERILALPKSDLAREMATSAGKLFAMVRGTSA